MYVIRGNCPFFRVGQYMAKYNEKKLITLVNDNCDIIIGSRFVTKKKPFSMRMMRSRIISWCIKLTTGFKMTDPTSGMRIFNKKILRKLAYNMNHCPEPDTISYLIKQKSIRVKEVQVEMDERVTGESYLNTIRSVDYMVSMCFLSSLYNNSERTNNMSPQLRILLIIVSFLTAIFVLRKIRKAQMKINDAIPWIVMPIVLLLLGVFPQLAINVAILLGIESPVNFVYLVIIFLLIIIIFSLLIKLSNLEYKLICLVEEVAIRERLKGEEEKS